jgi:hypothetical protein
MSNGTYREHAEVVLNRHAIRPDWSRTGEQIIPLLEEAASEGHAAGERHQGWANRETWALMLHVNNDQGLCDLFRECARSYAAADGLNVQDAVKDLAESYFTPDAYYDMTGDVIQNNGPCWMAMQEIGSMWRVDWAEVTAALLED